MTRSNNVTLFSNGIGHFRRIYVIPAGKQEEISIPFKRDHIGDVAASLQVFGQVRLNTPPSFTPSNANATSLTINQHQALKSLIFSLSGATVEIKLNNGHTNTYTLLGLDTTTSSIDGGVVENDFVVVMNAGGVRRYSLNEVSNIDFTEESVRTEITKALKNNFQKIKPDSTLMDLSLSATQGEAEATIQYTIPVAAWKMRYAIREAGGKFTLEGAAIIDNNTDEDWDNFQVSVVTGNPISFSTDIADIVVPNRKMVRLVDNESMGVVDGFETMSPAVAYGHEPVGSPRAMRGALGPKLSIANYASCSLEGTSDSDADILYSGPIAEAPGVESKDVGDFCIFTSKEPITILARKSAVVSMFTAPLSKAGIVLLYRESNHARRPYRAVNFKNETEFSLGKGKTTIYNEGIFSGECVLDVTKPGETRMLPHCLENGVKIYKDTPVVSNRRSSIVISDGVVVDEHVTTAKTTYTIENKKDESFKVALEHVNQISRPNVVVKFDAAASTEQYEFAEIAITEQEKLVDAVGSRIYVKLEAKQKIDIAVTETSVDSSKFTIGNRFDWVKASIIDTKNPLAEHDGIQTCIKIQAQIDECQDRLYSCESRRKEIKEQAIRVRENLAAAKDVGSSETVAIWVKDLDDSEKQIRQLDKEMIPKEKAYMRKLQEELSSELRKITASWTS